jgi:hypothetical protein
LCTQLWYSRGFLLEHFEGACFLLALDFFCIIICLTDKRIALSKQNDILRSNFHKNSLPLLFSLAFAAFLRRPFFSGFFRGWVECKMKEEKESETRNSMRKNLKRLRFCNVNLWSEEKAKNTSAAYQSAA